MTGSATRKVCGLAGISALALAGFAITAGGCLGEPSASVAPNDLSSGHTVLLIGDSLMGGAATSLDEVLHDSRSGGISIVDAHLNGSGLVRPMDGMLPDDYRRGPVRSPPRHRRRRDGMGRGVREALPRVRDARVLPGVARQRGRGARGRQRARRRAHRRAATATTARFRTRRSRATCSPTWSGTRWRTSAGRRAVRRRPIGGRRSPGYDDAYYDTLFYEDAWHTVRVEDRIHFSADGRTRAAKVLAAAIQTALGMA